MPKVMWLLTIQILDTILLMWPVVQYILKRMSISIILKLTDLLTLLLEAVTVDSSMQKETLKLKTQPLHPYI